jgi:hypothetical protein
VESGGRVTGAADVLRKAEGSKHGTAMAHARTVKFPNRGELKSSRRTFGWCRGTGSHHACVRLQPVVGRGMTLAFCTLRIARSIEARQRGECTTCLSKQVNQEAVAPQRSKRSSSYSLWKLCRNRQASPTPLSYAVRMKTKVLTPKQLSSVPCPTCGVPIGKRCVLLSGAPRSTPHVDRRLSAAEAVERERTYSPPLKSR